MECRQEKTDVLKIRDFTLNIDRKQIMYNFHTLQICTILGSIGHIINLNKCYETFSCKIETSNKIN